MLTREQIYTMLILRKRENNIFSRSTYAIPDEIFSKMIGFTDCHPNSDIAKALQYAAYARKEDVTALFAMLSANPHLLLEAGNVITPGGLDCRHVTIFEFLLGAGDADLAAQVHPYFAKIPTGEIERKRQYARYKPHIEGMLTQKPYDLMPLIDILKQSSAADVNALLNKDMTHESVLRDAIIQFRNDFAPGILIKPRMHFNYQSLQHAFEKIYDEWDNLYRTSVNNYHKISLLWQLLIGFEMRRLPGVDRCVMAQGLYYVIRFEELARSYNLTNDNCDFPITPVDDSLVGLGGDFAVLGGDFAVDMRAVRVKRPGPQAGAEWVWLWKTHVEQKLQTFRDYAARPLCNFPSLRKFLILPSF